MLKIVLATSNEHKIEEINSISKPFGVEFELPDNGFDPIENGTSFEQNSFIKAKQAQEVEKKNRKYFLADDSGLCVDFLDGAPGIKSARYAQTPSQRIQKLIQALDDADDNQRSAKFVCSLVLLDEKGSILNKTKGICKGTIGHNIKGENGFGYDPIFIVDNFNKTMAELSDEEKNFLSHRARAFMDMLIWIKCKNIS